MPRMGTCPGCGRRIYCGVKACPHCGAPGPDARSIQTGCLIAFAVVVIVILIAYATGDNSPEARARRAQERRDRKTQRLVDEIYDSGYFVRPH